MSGIVITVLTATFARPLRKAQAKHEHKEGEATLSEATLAWARHLEETLSKQIAQMKQDYNKRIDEMARRITALEVENDAYKRHNTALASQLIEAGISPLPGPLPKRPTSSSGAPGDSDGET